MQIIPAILPKTREELIQKLQLLSAAGFSGRVQIDMCDGKYVESKTWPFFDAGSTQTSFEIANLIENDSELIQLLLKFQIDLDLMVSDADSKMILWNALVPDRIILHIDTIDDVEFLSILLAPQHGLYDVMNRKAVVFAFSLDTNIEKFDYWYKNFNMRNIQVMGIEHIGKQGEEFSDRTLDVIKKIQDRYPGVTIMVDGGVSISNVKRLSEYGISGAVAGSAVFKNNTIQQNLDDLQSVL